MAWGHFAFIGIFVRDRDDGSVIVPFLRRPGVVLTDDWKARIINAAALTLPSMILNVVAGVCRIRIPSTSAAYILRACRSRL